MPTFHVLVFCLGLVSAVPAAALACLNVLFSLVARLPLLGALVRESVAAPVAWLSAKVWGFCAECLVVLHCKVHGIGGGTLQDRRWVLALLDIEREGLVSAVRALRLELVSPGMTVTTISTQQGAPRGESTLHFSTGEQFTIKELLQEDGEWYAVGHEYSTLWFPLSSTDAGDPSKQSLRRGDRWGVGVCLAVALVASVLFIVFSHVQPWGEPAAAGIRCGGDFTTDFPMLMLVVGVMGVVLACCSASSRPSGKRCRWPS